MLRKLLRNFVITAYTMSITVKAMRKCCGQIFGCDSNLHSRYCFCTMAYGHTWTSRICIVPSPKR